MIRIHHTDVVSAILSHKDSTAPIEFIRRRNAQTTTNFSEFIADAQSLSRNMLHQGLKPGDELVIVSEDVAHFARHFVAALLVSIIPVPLTAPSTAATKDKVVAIWRQLRHPWIVADFPLADVFDAAANDVFQQMNARVFLADETFVAKRFVDKGSVDKGCVDKDSVARDFVTESLITENHVTENQVTDSLVIENLVAADLAVADLVTANEDERHIVETLCHDLDHERLAFIQYSSGSTGDPKGVKVTHQMLIADCDLTVHLHQITEQDTFLSWMPLSHDFGLIYFLIFPLICGVSFTVMPTKVFARDPVLWLERIHQRRATITGAPNYAFEHVMKMFKPEAGKHWDLSSIRYIINGAEPINADICRAFENTFSQCGLAKGVITPSYGLAETTLLVSSAKLGEEVIAYHCDRDHLKLGDFVKDVAEGCAFVDVGYPGHHVALRISDDTNLPFVENRIGRIQLKGNIVTPGYYFAPNRTEDMFTADGWLETGDLGFLRNGRLIITGRCKDIIIINGTNYYPQDIETICGTLPELGLNKVAASAPQDHDGKSLFVVFLLFRRGVSAFLPLAKQVEEILLRQLGIKPDYCLPVKRIPKTTSGKLKRFDLVQQFQQGQFDDVKQAMAQAALKATLHPLKGAILSGDRAAATDQLMQLMLPLTPQVELVTHQPLMEQGFKSVHLTELSARINAALNTHLPVSLLFDCPTIEQLVTELLEQSHDLDVTLPSIETEDDHGAAGILGIGCHFPGDVNNPTAFWDLLMTEKDLVRKAPEDRRPADPQRLNKYPGLNKGYFIDDPWCFDHQFFNITPVEALAMDPQQRLLLQCCWHAFEDAGIDPEQWRGKKVGVYLGMSTIDYDHILQRSGDPDALNAYRLTGNSPSIAAGRIAYVFNFKGPVITLDTACSSSLVAVHYALRDLRSRACDLAIVGGVNLILDGCTSAALTSMQALSSTGQSKTFSAQADGYGRGEGCAVLLLKRQADAEANADPIRALVKGSAMNHDGASNGLTAPSGKAQQDVLQQALVDARCQPQDITFIETHGTGTALGDPIEVAAISQVYADCAQREFPLYLGSVKTNVGHLEAAAGITGIVKAALALQQGQLPATLHVSELNQHIEWSTVPAQIALKAQLLPSETSYAGISAFGLSGTNCHVILQRYSQAQRHSQTENYSQTERHLQTNSHLQTSDIASTSHWQAQGFRLPLSAKSPESLQSLIQAWDMVIDNNDEDTLDACCAVAATRRAHLPYRAYFYGQDKTALQTKLRMFSRDTSMYSRDDHRLAFVFAGQGCQYPAMAADLYTRYPAFRRCIDELAAVLKPVWSYDLIALLTDKATDQALLNNTEVTQVIVVAYEIALARLWQDWGVTPEFCVGHSIGEIAVAVVSESLTAKDAILLAAARGEIIAALPTHGAMAAVAADLPTVQAIIDRLDSSDQLDDCYQLDHNAPRLVVAAHNSPESQTISGEEAAVEACLAQLSAAGIRARRLDVSHAFHSPLLRQAMADFSDVVSKISFKPPKCQVISTLTGEPVAPHDWQRPEYWVNQLIHPVLFHEAMTHLPQGDGASQTSKTFVLEIAPKPTLFVVGKQCCPTIHWVCSQDREHAAASLHEAVSRLYQAGIRLNWLHFFDVDSTAVHPLVFQSLPLPLYPFQSHRHQPEELMLTTPIISSETADGSRHRSGAQINTGQINTEDPSAVTPQSHSHIKTDVQALIQSITGLSAGQFSADANWFALGLDSLVIVQIQQAVIKRFGIEFELGSLMGELDTCNKLGEKLSSLLPDEGPEAGTPAVSMSDAPMSGTNVQMPTAAGSALLEGMPLDTSHSLQALCQQQIASMNALFGQQLAAMQGHEPSSPAMAHPFTPSPASVSSSVSSTQRASSVITGEKSPQSLRPKVEIKGLYQALRTEKTQTLSWQQQGHLALLQQQLNQRTAGSKQYTAQYREYYANSRSIIGFKPETKEMAYPVHVVKAEGIYLWDIDGHRYLDITMGFGSILFGHNPDFIKHALIDTLDQGAPVGPQNLQAATAAEKLCQMTGNDRAAFFTNGTEAIMVGVRIARSVTKRAKIVIFHGAFHGSFDAVLASGWLEAGQPQTVPLTDGTPQSIVNDTIVLTYGDERSLDVIRQHADEIAAVVIEPVQSRNPALQPIQFVQDLRQLTQAHEIALICDDIILGFRYALDGSRSWLGITPDLVTYGKVLGGGQPIGVLAGQRKYMDAVDGGNWRYGDDSVPQSRTAFVAGTFNSHPLAMTAANAVLDKLAAEGEPLLQALNQRTEAMCRQLNEWYSANQLPIHMVWFGSLFRFEYSGNTELLNFHLLKNGLYVWEGRNCFLGVAHTDDDIHHIIDIIKRSVWELTHGGWIADLTCENQSLALPLSNGQRAMRFLLESQPEKASAYNEMMVLEFDQPLDHHRLQLAWEQVLTRHDALRVTQFTASHQFVSAAVNPLIPVITVAEEQQRTDARSAMLAQPFDLAYGPFWRLQIVITQQGCDVLVCFCHLIVDGWSMGLVMGELAEVYRALKANETPTLAPVIPLMHLLAKEAVKDAENGAESSLGEAAMQATDGRAAPHRSIHRSIRNIAGDGELYTATGHQGFRIQGELDSSLFDQVKTSAQRLQVSSLSVLMAAWALLLNRLSAQSQFTIGVPTAGHNDMGMGHFVGYASEVKGVEVTIDPEQPTDAFIQQITARIRQAQQGNSSAEIHPPQAMKTTENTQISSLFNVDRGVSLAFDRQPRWGWVPVCCVKQPLFLNILEFNGELCIDFDVNAEIASPALARLWLSHYMTIVEQLCTQEKGTQDQRTQDNNAHDVQTIKHLMFAVDPYQCRVLDAQGLPLFAGALGWHQIRSGQTRNDKCVARVMADGILQIIAPAELSMVLHDQPVCSHALLALLTESTAGLHLECYQDQLALVIEDTQHPLASYSRRALAEKITQRIAPPWQPVYLFVKGQFKETSAGEMTADAGYVLIREHNPATSELEIAIARLWAETIGLDHLPAVNESFVNLGGNSLAALSVIHKMQSQLHLAVEISDFLQAPGIEALIHRLETATIQTSSLKIVPTEIEDAGTMVCSNSQQRLLFLQNMAPQLCAYNVGFSITFDATTSFEQGISCDEDLPEQPVFGQSVLGEAVLEASAHKASVNKALVNKAFVYKEFILEKSIRILMDRHSVLRCCFPHPQAAKMIQVDPRTVLSWATFASLAEADKDAQEQVETPFDLEQQLGWRIRVQQFADQNRLIITMHHAICDLWSVECFTREFLGTLKQLTYGYQLPEEANPLTYSDYAVAMNHYQTSTQYVRDLDDYTQRLLPLPQPIDLRPDLPRSPVRSLSGESQFRCLSADVSQQLYQLSRHRGYSLYAMTLGALALLVNQQHGAQQMIIGAVSAQRNQPDLAEIQGFFANTLAVRLDLSVSETIHDFMEYCAAEVNQMLKYGDLTLDTVNEKLSTEKLGIKRQTDRQPLLDVVLVMDERETLERMAQSYAVQIKEIPVHQNQFDFTLYASYSRRGIQLHALYNSDLYSQQRVADLLTALETLFTEIATQPDAPLPLNRQQMYALTAQQKRLWFVDAFENGALYDAAPIYYNMPYQVKLKGPVDHALLQQVLQDVVKQQPILHYRLHAAAAYTEEGACWIPAEANPELQLCLLDCQLDTVDQQLDAFNSIPFDLSTDLLMRAALAQCEHDAAGDAILQITAHHLIADKSALRRFTAAVLDQYHTGGVRESCAEKSSEARLLLRHVDLTPRQLPVTVTATQLQYWQQQLQQLVPLPLPEDIPREAVHVYCGEQITTSVTGLGKLAAQLNTSQRAAALALFHILLQRYSRQQDIVTGMVVTPRHSDPARSLLAEDNLVVIRSQVEPTSPLTVYVSQIEHLIHEAERHADVPFDEVVLAVNPNNDMSRTALFDVLFVFDECDSTKKSALDSTSDTWEEEQVNAQGWGKYDLVFNLTQSNDESDLSQLALCFNRGIYHPQRMRQMLEQFSVLLRSALHHPEGACQNLNLITDAAAQQQIQQWGDVADYPREQTIVSAINAVTQAHPQRVALHDRQQQLNYTELNRLTDILAKNLLVQAVQRENVVAIYMERGLLQSLVILAILKAGGAYLVLDKKHPPARRFAVMEDADVRLLVTDETSDCHDIQHAVTHCLSVGLVTNGLVKNGLAENGLAAHTLRIDQQPATVPANVALPEINPEQLAYMIYTSGSTGVPKGVQIEHRHVVQLVLHQESWFDFSAADRWSLFHSYAFDFSVWETFGAWMTGGAVCVVPTEATQDSQQFLQVIQDDEISILSQTPGAFYALLEQLEHQGWPVLPLRMVIFGGEALQPARLTAFKVHYPQIRLINMYGITETTVHVTYKEIDAEDCRLGQSNIGKPLPSYGILLVDDDLKPCAPGVPGEMLVSGYGVTRGYLNRPELNDKAFISFPGMADPVFRSGDLARWTPQGELIYLGRKDAQVQLRGFRIELGEIEQVLMGYAGICNAAVVLVTDEVAPGVSGDRAAIMAWFVPESGHDDFSHGQLGYERLGYKQFSYKQFSYEKSNHEQFSYEKLVSWLGDQLPEYMIPARFYQVDEIPLNHNGKVDRQALMLHRDHPVKSLVVGGVTHDEIDSATDRELRHIWCEVLGVDSVNHDDNFFEIGGHSLKANSALLRIREQLCPTMTLKDFFSHPHFLVQASLIDNLISEGQRSTWPELCPLTAETPWVPSFSQQRLWLTQQQNTQDTSYNSVGMFTLYRDAHTPDFEVLFAGLSDALARVIRRHDVLRTIYVLENGELHVRLKPHFEPVLEKHELDKQGQDTAITEDVAIQAFKQRELQYVFDLENDGPIRAHLIKPIPAKAHGLAPEVAAYLLINMHHIASDGASVVVLMQELSQFYRHYFDSNIALPNPVTIQFQDFAAWQQQLHQSGALDAQITYWQQVFVDTIPQLNLPTDRPRLPHPDHVGALHICQLGEPLSAALRQYAQQQHCTLFMLLSTVTQLMLFRHSRQTDLVIGTPVIGRDHVALEPLIGCFLNVLPLRLHCSERQTFTQLMAQNRQTITEAFAHQQLAFDQLLEAVGYRKQAGRHALFDVQIILQNNPQMQLDFGNTHLDMHPEETVSAKFDLNIMFSDEANIELQLEYATALFDAQRTEEMMQDIISIAQYVTKKKDVTEQTHVTQQAQMTQQRPDEQQCPETLTIQEVLSSSTAWQSNDVTPSQIDRSLINNQIEEEDW